MVFRKLPGSPSPARQVLAGLTVRVVGVVSPGGRHPARSVLIGFSLFILAGALVLMLPVATSSGEVADFPTALFTATSAACVTGLVVVDTEHYWSGFGQAVLLVLIQVGGIGIITVASLLGLLVSRRFSMGMQSSMQAEQRGIGSRDVRRVVRRIAVLSIAIETALAVVLAVRFVAGYGQPLGEAVYSGVFHAVSAFAGAGFSLYSQSLSAYSGDAWVVLPVGVVGFVAGIGFPVLFEIARRHHRPRQWTLHTKLTLLVSLVLLGITFVFVLVGEWSNPASLGPMGVGEKLLGAFFSGTMLRSVGLTLFDVSGLRPETMVLFEIMMFIGGGSASTAGGIKVTTFAVLAFAILAEVRGEPTVHVLGRRLSAAVQRQALTIALLSVGLVMGATMVLLTLTEHPLDRVLFEVTSAFGTVGLSTGITGDLPVAGELVLVVLMIVGRLGSITAATALALRERRRRYELPEERLVVG
ncbi:TrkH family potassium uptake protein [Pseudonocardia parietis]|uniref:Trk-type K+ transport system membrane component n=1 Tax=Pseudonocardia parietis TaxID=570936 RepID=A0ABS4VPR1_9PSEU|nr:potassium transporter TrkG [Pseudonocardia parietis]MBP2365916.1 Trk-type K+ transport system membrane component [Pseudonocardia parietis]